MKLRFVDKDIIVVILVNTSICW